MILVLKKYIKMTNSVPASMQPSHTRAEKKEDAHGILAYLFIINAITSSLTFAQRQEILLRVMSPQ